MGLQELGSLQNVQGIMSVKKLPGQIYPKELLSLMNLQKLKGITSLEAVCIFVVTKFVFTCLLIVMGQ